MITYPKIQFIHIPSASNPFLVIDKPAGIPSAPLSSDDTDNALSFAAEKFPEILHVHGRKEIEHGLVHRIDTATRGLLLIAVSQNAYDAFCRAQEQDLFIKRYRAECTQNTSCADRLGGFPVISHTYCETLLSGSKITISSFFRAYGTGRGAVRPVTETSHTAAKKKTGTRLYTTVLEYEGENRGRISVDCTITAGYRHQVRCHLAWIGLPIIGDPVYNPNIDSHSSTSGMHFTACSLQFPHPLTGKSLIFKL